MIMKVTAKLKNLRISPRKVRLVADAIKGMNTDVALVQVNNIVKRSSDDMEKLLKSAIANAENNFGLDGDNLYVSDIQVGEGPRMKRWLPRAHGRATLILKRTSHVYLTLDEREEGKNRKSKEQLEKEKAQRVADKEKLRKEYEKALEEDEQEEKAEGEDKKAATSVKKEGAKAAGKKGQDSGWMKKVFQRKSA
jgi:large subunit ribosomal protein L22